MPKMASQSTPEATWPTNYVTTVQPQHPISLNEKDELNVDECLDSSKIILVQ